MKTKTLLRLYLVVKILEEPLFWGPIILVSLAKLGNMSTADIFLSEALAVGLVLVLDAPSGILADMFGRKKCVVAGKLCLLSSAIFLAFMNSPLHGYIANALWAIGVSLRSGADSALIYDELNRRGEVGKYQELTKKIFSYRFFIGAFTTLLAGFLAEVDLRLPLLLSLPGVVLSSILILFFPKELAKSANHTLENYRNHMGEALKEVWGNKRLKSLIVWLALVAVTGKIYFFTYNPYLELVGIPYSQVGVIFCGINVFAFIASRYAFQIHAKLQCVGFGWSFGLPGAVMIIQASITHYLCGWLFIPSGGMRWGYINTIEDPLLNKEVGTERRATVLSFKSSLSSMFQVIGFLLTAPLAGNITILLATLGVVSILLGYISRKI